MPNPTSFLDPLRTAGFAVDFVPRVQGITGSYHKEEGLRALEPDHQRAVTGLGYHWEQLWRAEQIHGHRVTTVPVGNGEDRIIAGVDGLMTCDPSALLGIYVADCGLVWLGDRETGAVALLHSGRKGTEGGILTRAVAAMGEQFGTRPQDLIAILGPCIRPPLYEVDIAEMISQQAHEAGVGQFYDCGICTGAEVESYYSYRVEKGLTGRMLGLLASQTQPEA